MLPSKISLISLLFFAAATSHCGRNSQDKKGDPAPNVNNDKPVVDPGSNQTAGQAPVIRAQDLAGIWVGPCHEVKDEESNETSFEREAYVITDQNIQWLSMSYAALDKDCKKSLTTLTMVMNAVYGAPSKVVPQALDVDLTITKVLFQMNDPDMVKASNQGFAFGHADWQTGVAKDITTSADLQFQSITYTIFKVENDQLARGELTDALDGLTAKKRPNMVESERYTRTAALPADAPEIPSPEPDETGTGPVVPPAPAEFQGTWADTCDPVYDSTIKKKVRMQWNYVFSGSQVLWKILSFQETDQDCTQAINVMTYVMTGRFGKESVAEPGAFEVDLIFERQEYRIDDDEGILDANARKLYGFSDWQKGLAKDVSQAPGISPNWPVYYSLFKVDEEGLHLANSTDGRDSSSPSKRPVKVSTTALKRLN